MMVNVKSLGKVIRCSLLAKSTNQLSFVGVELLNVYLKDVVTIEKTCTLIFR